MRRALSLIFLAIFLCLCATEHVLAECIPSDDPCAPQKKVGEWEKSALVGFNYTSGNSDTTLLTAGLKADFDDNTDVVSLSTEYGFSEDDSRDDPDTGSTSRNDFRAGARYDRLLSERFYFGMGSKYLYDEIADIDYRVSLDPNLGYFLLRDNSFKFKIEGGPSYIFEKVGEETDDYLAPRIADRFEWAISCTSKLYQSAELLVDSSDSDNYLVNAEVGIEAAISSSLALVVTVRESYDNQPAEDKEKDDLAVITSLKVLL